MTFMALFYVLLVMNVTPFDGFVAVIFAPCMAIHVFSYACGSGMKPDDRQIAARRKTISALKSILCWSSSFIVAFIAVALIVPMHVDYSSREESFAMIKRLEKMQKEIEPEIQDGKWV